MVLNMTFLYCSIALLFLLQGIKASPTGAPESACQTLKPNHGHQPQPASTFPYIVSMATDSYSSSNDKITVTLKSPAGGKPAFKGFLLAARNEQNKAFGSWKSSSGHELSCAAITHNNNNDKTNAVMIWHPPSNATSGKVSMTIAVVQNVSTFWINIPLTPVSGLTNMDASASSTNHKIIATTKNLHKTHTLRTHSSSNGNPAVTIKPSKAMSTSIKPKTTLTLKST